MTQPPSRRNGEGNWHVLYEEERPPGLTFLLVEERGRRIELETISRNGEVEFYRYTYVVHRGGADVLLAEIWTEGRSVRHRRYNGDGRVLSDTSIFQLTCRQDIVTTSPAVSEIAMRYLNIGEDE